MSSGLFRTHSVVATTAYHMSAGIPGWLRRVSSSRGVMAVGLFPDIVVVVVVSRDCDGILPGPSRWGLFPYVLLCRSDVTVGLFSCVSTSAEGVDIQALPAINQMRRAL